MADKRKLQIELNMKNNTGKALNTFDKKVNSSKNTLLKFGKVLLVAFSINLVKNFVMDSVRLYGIQEKAVARLTNVMRGVNGATDEQIQSLQDFASELQKVTTFGDEQIISAQAMLGTFQLNTEQIKQLTPRILDMGSAMEKSTGAGTDLESITIAIGKAMTSGIGSLSRYGVVIKEADKNAFELADKQEKLNIITSALDANFKGIAEGSAKTFSGRLDQLQNNFGDLKEQIGKAFLVLTNDFVWALSGSIEATNDSIRSGNNLIIVVNKLKIAWRGLGTSLFITAKRIKIASATFNKFTIGAISELLGDEGSMDFFQKQIDESTDALIRFEEELAGSIGELDAMNIELAKGTFDWNEFIGGTNKGGASLGEFGAGAGEAGKKTEELKSKLEKVKSTILSFNEKLAEAFDKTKENLKELTKQLKDLAKQGKEENIKVDNEFAQAFVDQEIKVEELRAELGKETDAERRKILQERLKFEEAELERFKTIQIAFEDEVEEIRRRNSLSDIARVVEDLNKKRLLLDEELKLNIKKIQDEIALENEKFIKFKELEELHIKQIDIFNAQREKMTLESINRQIGFYNQLAKAISSASSGKTTSKLGLSQDIESRAGQEINPINITINGDVTGQEIIEKVKAGIMQELNFATRFAQ